MIVRHGETEWSRSGRHTGRSDIALDAVGRERARTLRTLLARWQFAAVYTSPLLRARETCELAGFGNRAGILPDLVEWDYGAYEGRTTPEIREQRPGWVLWRDGVPGGETLDEVSARADRVVALVDEVEGDVLLVSHGHVLRVLTARWLQLPAVAGQRFFLATGAPSELGYEHDWSVMRTWNIDGAS